MSGERVDPEQVQAILRRALDLDVDGAVGGIDREALTQAAREVGVSPDAVHRALAEHDAGLLPALTASRKALLGDARGVASATVSLGAEQARARVRAWLKDQVLELHRRDGNATTWTPRNDWTGRVRRKLNPGSRIRLASAIDSVTETVVAVDEDRALVRLEADFAAMRRGLVTGVVAVPAAAGPIAGLLAAGLTGEVAFALGGLPAGALLGVGGVVGSRRLLSRERDEATRVLQLFLDDLPGADRSR